MNEFQALVNEQHDLDRASFVAQNPVPVLLFLRSESGRRLTAEAQRRMVDRRTRRLTKDQVAAKLETSVFIKERLLPPPGKVVPLTRPASSARPNRPFLGVGRDEHCDVVLSHRTIALRHACLFPGDPWKVSDMGTRHGTWVRGKAIPPMGLFELRNQDDLRFGNSEAAVFLTPHGVYQLVQACLPG